MSEGTKRELLERSREQYGGRGRQGKSRLLNELEELTGLERKHLIKVMNGSVRSGSGCSRGRPRRYGPGVGEVVEQLWWWMDQPCGKRMVEMIGLWLPAYEKGVKGLSREDRTALLGVSARTLDRLLEPLRTAVGAKRRRGRTGGWFKEHVPVRCGEWEETDAGWLELDAVGHHGGHVDGDYYRSITMTDILTGWTEARACWNLGRHGVVEVIGEMEEALPFRLLGIDTDNGPEFMNHHLAAYFGMCRETGRQGRIHWTRSRAYRKNDQAHIEQKNRTHVREALGHDRFDVLELGDLLNGFYREAFLPLKNFFHPVMKLVEKYREGSRWRRRYDEPATPCDRICASSTLSEGEKKAVLARRERLDPIELAGKAEWYREQIRSVLERKGSSPGRRSSGRPTGSLRPGDLAKKWNSEGKVKPASASVS